MKEKSLRLLIICAGGLLLLVVLGFARNQQNQYTPTEVNIEILNEGVSYFIGIEELRRDVNRILSSDTLNYREESKPSGYIDLYSIESRLEKNPYIQHAEVYRQNGGVLEIKVELRQALARIQNALGQEYYMDTEGRLMPLTKGYAPNVILVSGKLYDSPEFSDTLITPLGKTLYPFLLSVSKDSLFRSLISEVVMDRKGELTLYPEIGNHKIEFGSTEGYADKLERLRVFYRQVLKKTGWDRYRQVSVKFKDQVVAVRRSADQPDITEFE